MRRRRLQLGAVIAAAILAVAILIAVSQRGESERPAGRADARRLFEGIPQSGIALGEPAAPVTMVEFADLQCPFCAQYARDALPTIVERYVRTGRVRLELRVLRFLGPDSERAAAVALAAAAQDRMWQFSDLFYRNQGAENSGYATPAFLRKLTRATPGLDAARAMEEAGSRGVERRIARGEAVAERAGIESTPSFLVGRTGARLEPFEPGSLDPAVFGDRLDELLQAR